MSESVNRIVLKQMAFVVALALVVIVAVAGTFWWLISRSSASAPASVPMAAISDCEDAIKARMQNPGTVKFLIGGVSTKVLDNGGYLVRRSFKASNALGMESQMRGLCSFPAGGGEPFVTFQE